MSSSASFSPRNAIRARESIPVLWLVLFSLSLVLFSYKFHWMFLRALTLRLNLGVDSFFGVHWERISQDVVQWKGQVFHYENACTFVDVWFGALPLLWRVREGVVQNFGLLAMFSAGLLGFNIVRLSASDILFAHGLPWWLAHSVLSAFAYFLVWCWIVRQRAKFGTGA
jgi:hypothetical protein